MKERMEFAVFIYLLGFITGVAAHALLQHPPTYVRRAQMIYNVCPKLVDNIPWCP